MKDITKKLILEGHKYSSQYKNGLSNHLPMALYALDDIGADDKKIEAFYDKYIGRLEKCKPAKGEVITNDISNYLSEPDLFSDLVIFFEKEVKNKGLVSVFNKYLPTLFNGVSGAAFHPLIRLAFAVEMQGDTEIAHALASWVIAYQELKGKEKSESKYGLLESLITLKNNPVFDGYKPEGYGVFRRMESISKHKGFTGYYHSFEVNESSLAEMADICIKLYLSSCDNFTALHAVTSCHALRVVTEHCKDKVELFHHYWHAVGAAYIDVGMPEIIISFDTSELPSWEQIQSKATESSNDHLIKLVYTCKEEFEFYKSPLYQLAASQKVGLIKG